MNELQSAWLVVIIAAVLIAVVAVIHRGPPDE